MTRESPLALLTLLGLALQLESLAAGGRAMSFTMKTRAFLEGEMIPTKYTCDGVDVSPGLTWTGAPAGTQSLTLIADDPDAPVGTWTHWIIWNIPPDTAALFDGVPKENTLKDGARQGYNDFKRIGYGGPCPPPGKPHRYFFQALSSLSCCQQR